MIVFSYYLQGSEFKSALKHKGIYSACVEIMATADLNESTTDKSNKEPSSTTDNSNSEITRSVYRNGRFWNPWDTWQEDESMLRSGFKAIFKEKNNSRIPSQAVSVYWYTAKLLFHQSPTRYCHYTVTGL